MHRPQARPGDHGTMAVHPAQLPQMAGNARRQHRLWRRLLPCAGGGRRLGLASLLSIATFRLAQREAEVLYWVVRGKTSNDIGDILGNSPCTVNKDLEHVFEKLGVETRTAAANLALGRMRGA